MTEEEQIDLVENYPWGIREISNPSTKIQLVAVKFNWLAIRCIRHPSLEVQLYVVQQDGLLIQCMLFNKTDC